MYIADIEMSLEWMIGLDDMPVYGCLYEIVLVEKKNNSEVSIWFSES